MKKKLLLFTVALGFSAWAMADVATFEAVAGFGYVGVGPTLAIDLDGNGYQSVIYMENATDKRSVYVKNNAGSLSVLNWGKDANQDPIGLQSLGIPFYENPAMVAIDVNHDGKQDLIIAPQNVWPPVLDVYISNGINSPMTKDESQSGLRAVRDYAPYNGFFAAGDYDGDGWEDLFTLGQINNGNGDPIILSIYRNNNGLFELANESLPACNGGSITVGYVNNDNYLDLFYSGVSGSTNQTHLYYGDGNGNWTNVTGISFDEAIKGDVAIIDFDNDGDGDLLQYGHQNNNDPTYYTNIYRNNGDGSFTKLTYDQTGLPLIQSGWFMDYGDFNLDGLVDVIVSKWQIMGSGNCGTAIYYNNGNWTFTKTALEIHSRGGGVFAWDYDQDHKCDYIVWSYSDERADTHAGGWYGPIVHNTTIPSVTISENTDNTAVLSKWNGQTANVTLTRNMEADGYFHTLCLPFALTAEQITAAFGAGYELKALEAAAMDDETLNLTFEDASAISAGVPYLFKPAASISSPIVINGVTLTNTPAPQTKNDLVTFTGVFNPTEMTEGNKNTLILGGENALGWPSATAEMPGLRAYFEILGVAQQASAARAIFDHQVPTGIDDVQRDDVQCTKVFRDGQIVIISNGIRYNVLGQRIH